MTKRDNSKNNNQQTNRDHIRFQQRNRRIIVTLFSVFLVVMFGLSIFRNSSNTSITGLAVAEDTDNTKNLYRELAQNAQEEKEILTSISKNYEELSKNAAEEQKILKNLIERRWQ